ncbi:uncharacterized protein METZ01_LOCUS469845, partial [marine metagenome]
TAIVLFVLVDGLKLNGCCLFSLVLNI